MDNLQEEQFLKKSYINKKTYHSNVYTLFMKLKQKLVNPITHIILINIFH